MLGSSWIAGARLFVTLTRRRRETHAFYQAARSVQIFSSSSGAHHPGQLLQVLAGGGENAERELHEKEERGHDVLCRGHSAKLCAADADSKATGHPRRCPRDLL
eukprot:symbB.v1.2.024135.t1/scaffold2263.1/size84088/4